MGLPFYAIVVMVLSVALLTNKAGFCAKDGNLIQLVNIYAPNYAKPASAFFESYQMLDPGTPTVLCGGFNTLVDPIKDFLDATLNHVRRIIGQRLCNI